MKSDNGALSFEADIDNEKLIGSVNEMEKHIQGFSKSTVKAGGQVDDVFKITADNIRIQKDVIAKLETNVNNLNIEISKLKPGTAQEQLKNEAKQVAAELKAEKDALKQLEQQVEKTETAHVSMRGQMRQITEQLFQMEKAGLKGTDAYKKLQREAAELGDQISDLKGRIKDLGNDERMFQGIISGVSGVAGGFSAAQGAVGLFAGENENLNKIMLKVQSLMAITIGLQQIAQTLNKDEAFMTVIVAGAKDRLAAANIRLATALGISTVAAQVLMATLTLGLSIAITAIVIVLAKLSTKSAEAKKEMNEFNKSVSEGAAESIISFKKLSSEWDSLGSNLKAKEQFIKDNADSFKDLGMAVNGVADAERILSDPKNVQAFINAQVAKAKAMAATSLATEKYKEILQKQLELEKEPEKITVQKGGGYMGAGSYTAQVDNPKRKALEEEKALLEKQSKDWITKATDFSVEEKKLMNTISAGSTGIITGSIKALKDSIARLEEQYDNATDSKKRAALLKKLNDEKKLLAKMDTSSTSAKSGSAEDPFKQELDRKKNLYGQYFKWVNSNDAVLQKSASTEFASLLKQGASYMDYLKQQQSELMSGKQTTDVKTKLKKVNDAIADEAGRTVLAEFEEALKSQLEAADTVIAKLKVISDARKLLKGDGTQIDTGKGDTLNQAQKSIEKESKQQTDRMLEEYASFLQKKIRLQQEYNADMLLLGAKLQEATTPEGKAEISTVIENRTVKFKNDMKSSGDSDYDAMLQQYKSFEQRKQDVVESFDKQRAKVQEKAIENGITLTYELMKGINDAQAKALSEISVDELTSSDTWTDLFGNLDNLTVSKMGELRDSIEAQWDKLELSPEALDALRGKITQVEEQIRQRNPFKALSDGLKKYKEEQNSANLKGLMKGAASSIDLIKGSFDAVVGSLDKMGVKVDDQTSEVLNDVSGMLGGASNVAMGIATGNPLKVIEGVVGLVSNAIDLFDKKSRDAARKQKAIIADLDVLKKAYEKLEKAISKAFSTDAAKLQKEEILNIQAQIKANNDWIDQENRKKKKKRDQAAIEAKRKENEDLQDSIQDKKDAIIESLTGTSVMSAIDDFAGAYADAFMSGENAAAKSADVVKGIFKNALLESLKKDLQPGITQLMNMISTAMSDGVLSAEEKASIEAKKRENDIIAERKRKQYEEVGLADSSSSTTMKGAIQGASEESISMLSGYANAVRIQQIEAIGIMRQSLFVQNAIENNTRYCMNLVEILNVLKTIRDTESLRPQGL